MVPELLHEFSVLAQAIGYPLPSDWAVPFTRFADQWQHYLEYQVSLDTGALGLITLGEEACFLDEIEAYLRELNVSDEALAILGSLRRYAGQATWGLKLSPGAEPEAQLYVKKPLPVTEVLFWLRQREAAGPDAIGQVAALAARLGKSHTHFLGVDFAPGRPARYQIYFTQYVQELDPVPDRVRQIVAELSLPTQLLDQFERYHPLLAQPEQTLWLSVGLADGMLLPSLKLDYEGVRLGVAGLVLEDLQQTHPQLDYLDRIVQVLQLDMADYLGLRLALNRPPALSTYLTRVRGA